MKNLELAIYVFIKQRDTKLNKQKLQVIYYLAEI